MAAEFILNIPPHLRTKQQHEEVKRLRASAPGDAVQLVFYNSGDAVLEDYYADIWMWEKHVEDYDVSSYEEVSEGKIRTNKPFFNLGNVNTLTNQSGW